MNMLLGAVLIALATCALICLLALVFFPWFRSGERKEGHFRADQSTGSFHVDASKGLRKLRTARASSSELPLVGGPALVIAILVASVATGFIVELSPPQWTLLGVLLLALIGFATVGFVDDWMKVHRGVGISELQKFIGVFLVSLASAIAINRLVLPKPLTARHSYPPYSDIPGLGHLLVDTKFAWIAFFVVMTIVVTSATSLAVDFADGMDGLCGGLTLSASLAFAVIVLSENFQDLWPAVIAMLAIAGAVAGFLPFNWPSSWKARNQGWGRRRAKLIMGDTGSLALGGLLALVAIVSRLEFVLIFIGGVFVLEGLSALISARILVKFFRKFLFLERFGTSRGFAHTEFPLPFLATPMHHHYDLLNWDRKRLVYGAWALGAVFGLLGIASTIAPLTWERYLARFVAFLLLVFVWQAGPWTKSFFIGLARPMGTGQDAPRHLALCYGFPYRLFGRRLYKCIDITDITEDATQTVAEQLTLWQRMSVFDARSVLGYYCFRADALEDALRVWGKLPKANLERRPDIAAMLVETRHMVALSSDDEPDLEQVPVAGGAARETSDVVASSMTDDPNATLRAQLPVAPGDLASGAWPDVPAPESVPPPTQWQPHGLHDASADFQEELVSQQSVPLWNPTAYTDWASSTAGSLSAPPDLASEPHPVGVPTSPSSPHSASMPPDAAPADEEGDTLDGRRRSGQ